MPSQIRYRHTAPFPAATLCAALVDEDFLRARMAELGGPQASIVSHRADEHGAEFTLRHELDTAGMPAAVRGFLAGRIVLERSERWTGPTGTVEVAVIGAPVPASATGTIGVAELGPATSEFQVDAAATVSMPLFGAQIEQLVATNVQNLLALESQFTTRWLEQRTV